LLFADITGEIHEFSVRSYFTGTFAGTITALAVVQLLLAIICSGAAYSPRMSLVGAKWLFVAVAAVAALAAILALIDHEDFFAETNSAGPNWQDAYPYLGLTGESFFSSAAFSRRPLPRGVTTEILLKL
jgi:hypothetical protein